MPLERRQADHGARLRLHLGDDAVAAHRRSRSTTTTRSVYFESVDRIDDYTLRIVGTRPSWRPLYDYGLLCPLPRTRTVLDETGSRRTNNQPQIAVGPYVVSEVVARRVGDVQARCRIGGATASATSRACTISTGSTCGSFPTERKLDYLRRGELDMIVENTAQSLERGVHLSGRPQRLAAPGPRLHGLAVGRLRPAHESRGADLPEQGLSEGDAVPVQLRAVEPEPDVQRVFPPGVVLRGHASTPIPSIRSYPFDPQKAREHLERAGYHRPDAIRRQTLVGSCRQRRLRPAVHALRHRRHPGERRGREGELHADLRQQEAWSAT